jgi:MSHA biogenesis protein MshO
MTTRRYGRLQRGFTLVEAVLVIAILGILGGMVALFIQAPMQSYVDSVDRSEVSDVADLALRRMARDLRLALPNSIRVSSDGNSIEFLLIRSGGRYLSAEDGFDLSPVLDFLDRTKTSVTTVGPVPNARQNDFFVVNNLGEGFSPANAYDLGSVQRNITQVASISGNVLSLADNPFADQIPPSPSPSQRYFIVSGPVSYYCGLEADGTTRLLTRQSGYPINANQVQNPVPPGGNGKRSLLAANVGACQFQYQSLVNQNPNHARSALVILTLQLKLRGSVVPAGKLVHQIHVDNTP